MTAADREREPHRTTVAVRQPGELPQATDTVELPHIAVLGAGKAGSAIARVAVESGYEVSIAASGDPDAIALIAKILVPGATPRWAADAIGQADIVVLALPLHRLATLDPEPLAGKLVIDAMNYWPDVDGTIDAYEDGGSSEVVQQHLAAATVVKTLNHVGYHELEEEREPAGAADRHALAVAGDDPAAVATIAAFVEQLGFDAVPLDSLRAGAILAPHGPAFGVAHTRAQLQLLARDTRASFSQ